MDVLVERLAERMRNDPDNLQGWLMLGRSYLAIDEGERAAAAFAQAQRVAPDDADALLGQAEALAKVQASLEGRPAELARAALTRAPDHPNALWMVGLIELRQGNPGQAVTHWSKLAAQLDPGSQQAATLQNYIAQAREQAGTAAQPAAAQAVPTARPSGAPPAAAPAPEAGGAEAAPAAAAAPALGIRVEASLADELRGRAGPDDTLFVFARALAGPPMPLAVKRLRAGDLPVSVVLDDSMAMMPQMRLSNFEQVVVGARISKTGNAVPQSGDLQGEVQPVTPGTADPVRVRIDTVRP
jgi:cytochrome c-type biogenesis protein CcmH